MTVAADFGAFRASSPGGHRTRAPPEGARPSQARLERALADAATGGRGLVRTAGDLDSGVRSLRMVPFAEAGLGLERAVRDLAHAAGKDVVFKLVGPEVELDRAVAERLKSPLLHLVRNAVDHGIGTPPERAAAASRPTADHGLRRLKGSREIAVSDDGRGLTASGSRGGARSGSRVRRRPDSGPRVPPGLSTARALTAVAGRAWPRLADTATPHGTVALESAGRGHDVHLTVP